MVRKVNGGMVSTVAGTTSPGNENGTGTVARFSFLFGCVRDKKEIFT
jgi:hypothetical protein